MLLLVVGVVAVVVVVVLLLRLMATSIFIFRMGVLNDFFLFQLRFFLASLNTAILACCSTSNSLLTR